MPSSDDEIRAWLSAIVESSSDAIIGSRLDGTIFSWNPGAEALYGYTAAEAIGQPVAMLIPPERAEELARILNAVHRGERIPGYDTVRLTKDGRRIEVSITASPVVSNGRVLGASAIARSIEERRRYEGRLLESEQRLSTALLASGTGTFRWHIDSDRLEWDDSLRQLFGVTRERRIAQAADFMALVLPEDREALWREVQSSIAECRSFTTEFRIVWPDGSIRWIADKASIFCDADGRPEFLTGACRDVTEEKAAEQRLHAALREKEALLQQKDLLLKEVNHRVKNGLQMVASLLNLQSRFVADAAIRRQLDRAAGRVMTVARVHERLYQSGEIGRVELGPYLRGMCDDIIAAGAADAGEIRIAITAPPIAMSADRVVLLGLIVNELVTNALRHAYTGGSGLIDIGAKIDGADLEISVCDSGAGLPAQVEDGRRRGFGMTLIEGLSQQLGGRLRIDHDATGTRASIVLALEASHLAEAQGRAEAAAAQATTAV